MQGEHIESLNSIAERTAKSFNVRVRNDISEDFIQISKEFPTEDDAVQYCIDNDLDNKYKWVRIYTDKGLHISGWNEIVISGGNKHGRKIHKRVCK